MIFLGLGVGIWGGVNVVVSMMLMSVMVMMAVGGVTFSGQAKLAGFAVHGDLSQLGLDLSIAQHLQ